MPYIKKDYNDNSIYYQLSKFNRNNKLKINMKECDSIVRILGKIVGFKKNIAFLKNIVLLEMELTLINVEKIVNFPMVMKIIGNRCIGIENDLDFDAMFTFLQSLYSGN